MKCQKKSPIVGQDKNRTFITGSVVACRPIIYELIRTSSLCTLNPVLRRTAQFSFIRHQYCPNSHFFDNKMTITLNPTEIQYEEMSDQEMSDKKKKNKKFRKMIIL